MNYASYLITPQALWIVLLSIFVFFGLFSLILIYHWRKFGMKNKKIAFMEFLFFSVSFFLILVAFFLLLTF